jgi:hypothetical protein
MKENMKLTVFVIIAAMAIFVGVATAAAGDRDRDYHQKGIIGEWGFSGGGNCTLTPATNYAPTTTNPLNLTDSTKVSFSSYHAHGIVTFKPKGVGTIDFYTIGTPTAPLFTGASAWNPSSYHITYSFTYTVTDDGEMTFEADANTMKQEALDLTGTPTGVVAYRDHYSLAGWVSADHKTITLATPAPRISTNMDNNLNPLQKAICHDSQVCVRLAE